MHPKPHSALTGTVAGQQSIAIEARGTAFATGPRGMTKAAATSARQGVTVTEDHVGVSIATAVTGLTGAAQHQRISKKARRTARNGGDKEKRGSQDLVAPLRVPEGLV